MVNAVVAEVVAVAEVEEEAVEAEAEEVVMIDLQEKKSLLIQILITGNSI